MDRASDKASAEQRLRTKSVRAPRCLPQRVRQAGQAQQLTMGAHRPGLPVMVAQ